ncbi:hypothetical protein [Streptomyces luteireticuli]|uniref:hypothetical protein n=1 Tax=Streptomyces luteireticuli TaxID=173858 RepID=UPI003559181E
MSTRTPLNTNGHDLLPKRTDNVMVVAEPGEEPMVVGAHWRCATCDERPTYVLRDGTVHVQDPCPYLMGITTEITLDVPSGKLIVTDDLRDVYDVDFDAGASYSDRRRPMRPVHRACCALPSAAPVRPKPAPRAVSTSALQAPPSRTSRPQHLGATVPYLKA